LLYNRKPYHTEVIDEVAREYTRQQTKKRKAGVSRGANMDNDRSCVVEMEESVNRLESKIGKSYQHMEDILKAILRSQGTTPHFFGKNSM